MITQKDIWWVNSLFQPKPSEEAMMTKPVITLETLKRLQEQLKNYIREMKLPSDQLEWTTSERLIRVIDEMFGVEDKK
jgi:hypothetical protein